MTKDCLIWRTDNPHWWKVNSSRAGASDMRVTLSMGSEPVERDRSECQLQKKIRELLQDQNQAHHGDLKNSRRRAFTQSFTDWAHGASQRSCTQWYQRGHSCLEVGFKTKACKQTIMPTFSMTLQTCRSAPISADHRGHHTTTLRLLPILCLD